MILRRFLTGAAVGATVGGGISAGLTALAGATGAAIMKSAGYAGYVASEAAKMGAVGGAILGGGSGIIGGGVAALGIFSRPQDENRKGFCETTLAYTGGVVVGGLTGYGVLNSASTLVMGLGQTAAAFAVGGSVTMIPAGVALICIAVPLAACALACIDPEDIPSARPRV